MTELPLNAEREKALARLKCAHCQALMNCEALAHSILVELGGRFQFLSHSTAGEAKASDANLMAAVRDGIDRFLAGLMDGAA